MKFLCLAYGAEKDWKALTKDEQDALLAQDDVLRKRGALMAAVAPEVVVHGPQFVAIWESGSYDDLTRFVGESLHQKFARAIAKGVVRRRWVVNI